MTVVDIHPKADVRVAAGVIRRAVQKQETQSPESVRLIVDDFNHYCLTKALPKYHQYITCKTCGDSTIDLCYGHIPKACHEKPRNVSPLSLLSLYRQTLKSTKPITGRTEVRSMEATEIFSGCFHCTDWDVLLTGASLSSLNNNNNNNNNNKGQVKLQSDFNFTCTSPWTDGAVANSECVIPRDKFRNKTVGGICDIYSDTVVFTLTKADGNYSTCTVTKFDTTCDASLNADGCGCRERSGGSIIIDYNITAVRADHQGARIKCEPQCLDTSGLATILTASTANDCFNISVVVPTTTTPTVAPTTSPPDTTSESPGTTTESSESPISPTATGSPTATSTGNSNTSGPAIPPTGNSGTSGPASPTTGNSSTSSSTDSTPIATSPGTTGNSSSTAARHSDQALYIGLGFVGLVCLVGIVVVCVLIVRRRKSRKKLATASANDGNPDQEEKNNHAYINTTL